MRLPAGITRPLRTPEEFSGARIAFNSSGVAERSLQTLGAIPVKSGSKGADMSGYDGLEQQIESIAGNQYDDDVKWITGMFSCGLERLPSSAMRPVSSPP